MNEFRENIKWLWRFYRPIKNRLLLIMIQSVGVAILSALIPYIFIRIIDGLKQGLSYKYLLESVGILLALGIGNFFISVTNATRRALTNIELEWHFRQDIFARLIYLDQNFYDKFRTGDILTRFTDDVGRKLSWFACSGIFRAWESILRLLFCLIMMTYINPWLTLISLAPFPLQIIVFLKSTVLLDSRFKALQKVISKVNNTIETCFSGIKIIQAYCMEERQSEKFTAVAHERADTEINAEKAHILVHGMYQYFWQFAQIIILLVGGSMVIKGTLTLGEFVAFDYYVAYLVWPMFDIAGLLVGYRRASVSIKRLRELDDFVPSIISPDNPQYPDELTGRVIFDNVTFIRNERVILDKISFDSEDHRMIAIVGEVGSGKSSVLNLMCRFSDPRKGELLIDNIPLQHWDLSRLRKVIGYVSQEPLLFTDSVKNNVKFGREYIDDETILWASKIAHLTDEVNTWKDGFDTPVGLRGMTVSGGQKQRISIARALAGRPQILILDDATSHLDAETEASLWKNIYTVLPSIRTFIVSHRTSTLERADLILVLKDGKIVEKGLHRELIEKKGEYYRIYFREKREEAVRGIL